MSLGLMRLIVVLIIPFAACAMNSDKLNSRDDLLIKMRKLPHPELLKARLYQQGLKELVQNTNVLKQLSGREKNLISIRSDLGFVIGRYNEYLTTHGKKKLSRLGADCTGIGIFEACLEDDEDYHMLRSLLKKLKWNRF